MKMQEKHKKSRAEFVCGINPIQIRHKQAIVSVMFQKRTIQNTLYPHRHSNILHTKTP
jgi:hypothetical protein